MTALNITIDEIKKALEPILPTDDWYTRVYKSRQSMEYFEDSVDNEVEVRWYYNVAHIKDVVMHLWQLTDFMKTACAELIDQGYHVEKTDNSLDTYLSLVIRKQTKADDKSSVWLKCRICGQVTPPSQLNEGCCYECYIEALEGSLKIHAEKQQKAENKIRTLEAARQAGQNLVTARNKEITKWRQLYDELADDLRALTRKHTGINYEGPCEETDK